MHKLNTIRRYNMQFQFISQFGISIKKFLWRIFFLWDYLNRCIQYDIAIEKLHTFRNMIRTFLLIFHLYQLIEGYDQISKNVILHCMILFIPECFEFIIWCIEYFSMSFQNFLDLSETIFYVMTALITLICSGLIQTPDSITVVYC